jgi:hypothetical protein
MDKKHQSAKEASYDLRQFLVQNEGSALKAWLRHFDDNNDQRVTFHEFNRGLRAMKFTGDIRGFFDGIDADGSGELTLEEIDDGQNLIWRQFRAWCVSTFRSKADLLDHLGCNSKDETINFSNFRDGIREAGWTLGMEELIFAALDTENKKRIGSDNMEWVESEMSRQLKKDLAKQRAPESQKSRRKDNTNEVLAAFKSFLKKRYGCFIRAWRNGLSPDGLTVLRKNQFFKACADIGYHKDVRILWKAFDRDDSGYMAIDELDLKSAEILARFHTFVIQRFGSASEAFDALDRNGTKRVSYEDFAEAIEDLKLPMKLLFHGLDKRGSKCLVESDLLFLDKWKPLPFLVASPSKRAMEEFKALLLRHFKRYLRAWRRLIDKDNSNRCNWDEFLAACKKLNYNGDLPGAWRALDSDLSGFITLR